MRGMDCRNWPKYPPYSDPSNLPWGDLRFNSCSARKKQNHCNGLSQTTFSEKTQSKERWPWSATHVRPLEKCWPATAQIPMVHEALGVKAASEWRKCSRAESSVRTQRQNEELYTSLLVFRDDFGGLKSHLSNLISLQCYNIFPRSEEACSRVGLYDTLSKHWAKIPEQTPCYSSVHIQITSSC